MPIARRGAGGEPGIQGEFCSQ